MAVEAPVTAENPKQAARLPHVSAPEVPAGLGENGRKRALDDEAVGGDRRALEVSSSVLLLARPLSPRSSDPLINVWQLQIKKPKTTNGNTPQATSLATKRRNIIASSDEEDDDEEADVKPKEKVGGGGDASKSVAGQALSGTANGQADSDVVMRDVGGNNYLERSP
jgi:hypothetical protein